MFADRIAHIVKSKNSRLVVGLDPHWQMIPDAFKNARGNDIYTILRDYFCGVVDAVHAHAAAFKPQIAFFEQFGIEGLRALQEVLTCIRERGDLVIMDGKRNDIGSTAAAYARAFFGDADQEGAFPSDALTVNGYLGGDGILPFLIKPEKGIFVLVKTSNPSSGEFQDQIFQDGTTLAEKMARAVAAWNGKTGESGYGNVGAVIGATYPEHMQHLRAVMPHSWILVPGYGAQGGSEDALRAAMDAEGMGALINSSRAICFPPGFADRGFQAVAAAADEAQNHLNSLIAKT